MADQLCALVSGENARTLVDSVDTVLSDCDGVLWNDDDAIPGAVETMQKLKDLGKKIFYVTNNSTKTRQEYMAKCQKMGLPVHDDCVISTAHATAHYIKNVIKYEGKVYCIGSTGLAQEFDALGIKHIGIGPDDFVVENMKSVAKIDMDPEVNCVVVGFDRHFNYPKIARAAGYAQRPGCHFIGTNTDSGLPMGDRVIPGTGALVHCVEVAANRKCHYIGKPSPSIMEDAMIKHNINPHRTIMFGDRCNTDVYLAGNCGFKSLLVLTGFSTLEEVERHKISGTEEGRKQVPSYYAPALGVLGKCLE